MKGATAHLSGQDVRDLAAHYGRQVAAPPRTRIPEHVSVIAARCDHCHGERGRGGQGRPRLSGQAEGYLVHTLREYQSGARRHPAMHTMSEPLNLIEVRALAEHYARQ